MSLEENPGAKGYALWLMPAEPAFSLLAGTISRLSREHSTPRFEPHVTLLGQILLPEERALARTVSLARVLQPFRVELGSIGYLDDYFRCLFVAVAGDDSIFGAHRAACAIFGRRNAHYMPHLSLLYGRLPMDARRRVATNLSSLPGGALWMRQLMLTRVDGPVHQWKRIQSFDLK